LSCLQSLFSQQNGKKLSWKEKFLPKDEKRNACIGGKSFEIVFSLEDLCYFMKKKVRFETIQVIAIKKWP
jgi:hypothetical protein